MIPPCQSLGAIAGEVSVRCSTALLLALLLAMVPSIPAAETASKEADTAARASMRGPDRLKAITELGERRPDDPQAVAKVLVDALLDTSFSTQIAASRSALALLTDRDADPAFMMAMAGHGDRLLTAAEAGMSERVNPPLEVLASISLPSDPYSKRLIALLEPGARFRRSTVVALSHCRPLTPEIRTAVLAESARSGLVQQDLTVALARWPSADLAGEDMEIALANLFDSDLGNVPAKVIQVVRQRAEPCPTLARRLLAIMDDPITETGRWSQALECYGAAAGQDAEAALIARLLEKDPSEDPDRFSAVVRHAIARKDLASSWKRRLLDLVKDDSLPWWTRSKAAEALHGQPLEENDAAVTANWREQPRWIIEVDSASGWPLHETERAAATAPDEEARLAWSITLALLPEDGMATDASGLPANPQVLEIARIARWKDAHPQQAWHPITTYFLLRRLADLYSPTPADRELCHGIMARILNERMLTDRSLLPLRYPQGGPSAVRSVAYRALVMAVTPDPASRTEESDPPLASRCEASRRLHEASAPKAMLLLADRELANAIRLEARRSRGETAKYRHLLEKSHFSLVPVADCLKSILIPAG